MCTLSVLPSNGSLLITMNRDESRFRPESGVNTQEFNGLTMVFPTDSEAGGTWFGFNSMGVSLALLNRYQDSSKQGMKTRGAIIPECLALGNWQAVSDHIKELDCDSYNPFDLWAFSLTQYAQLSWNGQTATVTMGEIKDPIMHTSSSVDTDEIIEHRISKFNQCEKKPDSMLRNFHLFKEPGHGSRSVMMERVKTHTKSVVQLCMNNTGLHFRYVNEEKVPTLIADGRFTDENSIQKKLSMFRPNLLEEMK